MDFDEVRDAVTEALSANEFEMLYSDFQDTLPPATQLALPRYFEKMRAEGFIELDVRFNAEALITELYISAPQESE